MVGFGQKVVLVGPPGVSHSPAIWPPWLIALAKPFEPAQHLEVGESSIGVPEHGKSCAGAGLIYLTDNLASVIDTIGERAPDSSIAPGAVLLCEAHD